MFDGQIHNTYAGGLWLLSAGVVASWFNRRRERARQLIYERETKPNEDEASTIRGHLVRDAFVGMAALIAWFLVLAWLF